MRTVAKNRRSKGKKLWLPLVIVVVLIASGAGYWFFHQRSSASAQSAATESYKTTQIRRGNITLSVAGSGTLIAGQESNLSFSTAGTVAKLNVQVGDLVKKGDTLAQLKELPQLQASVNSAQQDLISAQQERSTLKQDAPAVMANAQIALVNAQTAVTTAKSSVVQKGWERCDQATTDAYYYNYTHAQDALNSLGDGGGNADYYLKILVPQKNIVAQAKAKYEYCAGYTNAEVSSSQATLALKQAQETQAQEALDTLTKNNGLDPTAETSAENKVTSAQLALDKANEDLAGATLQAPFDGTILTVANKLGDSVGTAAFITIADLAHPQVQFSVDETDLENVSVGEAASVTLDAIPNKTYSGKVTRINPSLVASGGAQVVQGLIELDMTKETNASALLKGMNGSVTLVQASAQNILIAPIQALHDLGDGSYAMFVVGADGQPKMKVVTVGLQDAASAEIKSGVSAGDVVTTGTVQTK